MSRFLGEKSVERQVGGQGFAQRQLERRPAPAAAAGGSYRNPVMSYGLEGADWLHIHENTPLVQGFNSNQAWDPAVPGEAYFSNASGVAGDYFIMGMPLGPKGSRWSIDVIYRRTPTGGRVLFDWQTQPVDPTISSVVYPELLGAPVPGGTWYKMRTQAGYTYDIDSYGTDSIQIFTAVYCVEIVGDAGAMLSADGTFDSSSPTGDVFAGTMRKMNGGGDGSVMWYLRTVIDSTVNAANTSGNKDFTVYSLRLARLFEGGGESS